MLNNYGSIKKAEICHLRVRGLFWNSILFNCFFLVAIADVTSLNLSGGNIRWAWFALPFLYLLLPKGGEPKVMFNLTAVFFVLHLMSAAISGWLVKGFLYSSWILINYLFFFRAAYLLTGALKEHVWSALLWGGRAQIVLAIAFVLFGMHERAQFIYFEPSYLAIGLIPYLFTAIFWSRQKWIDGILMVALIAFNQSANMLIAICVAFVFWLFINRRIWVSVALVVLVVLGGYVFFTIALEDAANPNHSIALWIAENGISLDVVTTVLARAGNRVPRMQAALEMLDGHWFTGFGPGVYLGNTANLNFNHITDGLEYLDPAGLPVINVLLESITNAGLIAAILLIFVFLYIIYLVITRVKHTMERRIIIGAMIALGFMLQFESSYLRAYVWLTFGVFVARALHQTRQYHLIRKTGLP